MNNILLEYIWLDGYKTPNLRSKITVKKASTISLEDLRATPDVKSLPDWNFDGSSTKQAPGNNSERILKPVRVYHWKPGHYLVLCEVYDNNGKPHDSNSRAKLRALAEKYSSEEFWWGFEQEYFITDGYRTLGFPKEGYPQSQGFYYCGVGGNQVVGRKLVEQHLEKCLTMGIELTGTNAEVAIGQWEFQCFSDETLRACDDLWISRYVLYRLAEEYGWGIDLSPKPIHGDWNGSGCHTNFSTGWMRDGSGGKVRFEGLMDKLELNHHQHIRGYGEGNDKRLTGEHETQHIDTFSWGIGDRGASIRIPNSVEQSNWQGYIEDRRPASNCDPYTVAKLIVETTANEDVGYYEVEWTD